MRRFSQRQHLVTLADINITPLLDLAFVLLIIFIITTPLLEQGLDLRLPVGGRMDSTDLDPKNVWTFEVGTDGSYHSRGAVWDLRQIQFYVGAAYRTNQNLVVYIRADETTPYKFVAAILNGLEQAGVPQVSLRTKLPE